MKGLLIFQIQNITDEHMGRVDQMLKIKTAELSKG